MKYIYNYLYESGIFEYYKIYTNLIIQCKYWLILIYIIEVFNLNSWKYYI